MLAPLLAESRIPFEILFFLVAGAITLIGKLQEKAKKAREKIILEQQRQASRERMQFPTRQPTVVTPPPPLPPVPVIRRQKTVSAPVVMTPHEHTRGPAAQRRKRRPVPTVPIEASPDANYQRQVKRVHPAVRRLRANPDALRDAIVLREIFGPPVSLRMRTRPGTWQRR